jgi:hypothetical protein
MQYIAYLVIPFLIWLFVCACGIAPLIMLRYSNFAPVEYPIPIFEKALSVLDPVWIQEAGFHGKYAIQPLGVQMAIFTNPDNTIVMAVYFAAEQRVVDLVSKFPGNISLTTSTTIDGPVLPAPPGVIFQSFRGTDAKELLLIHRNGIDFLRKHLNADLVSQDDVANSMKTFIGRQLNNLVLRPWNILTLPYRWAVTRFARANLTLEQQAQKRIIDLESLMRQSQRAM